MRKQSSLAWIGLIYVALIALWLVLRAIFVDQIWWLALLNTFAIYLFVPLPLLLPASLWRRRRALVFGLAIPTTAFFALFGTLLLPKPNSLQLHDATIIAMTFNVLTSNKDTDALVNAIRATLGAKAGPSEFARLFQAVRIAVNDEAGELKRALTAFREALKPGGRLSIITYHSGEDRLVKQSFRDWARSCVCPPELPICICRGRPLGRMEPRKPIVPEPDELAVNPRARSAKLRIFQVDEAA